MAIGTGLTRWAFRGQASTEWGLSSAIERATNAVDGQLRFLGNREYWMRTQFARRAHHYLSDPPGDDRLVEWLALIQHHGGPTRLLDFSKSFYVAAFFALENAAQDAAVWALNLARIEEYADSVLNIPARTGNQTIYDNYRQYLAAAESILEAQSGPRYVLPVEPHRLNERLSIQQGFFMMGCDITSTFMENLAISAGVPANQLQATLDVSPARANIIEADQFTLIKIVLPHSLQYKALKNLDEMNINAATLFPGLDGFARSLRLHVHTSLTNARMRAVGIDPNGPVPGAV